jgi:hypothetical protein
LDESDEVSDSLDELEGELFSNRKNNNIMPIPVSQSETDDSSLDEKDFSSNYGTLGGT